MCWRRDAQSEEKGMRKRKKGSGSFIQPVPIILFSIALYKAVLSHAQMEFFIGVFRVPENLL